jgi:hypothetical protein
MAHDDDQHEEIGSPPFVTGGGGFDYHDRVAAYILAAMLAEQPPFGEETADVVKLDWETSGSGWRFDDLLMTCQGSVERRIAISCKSGRHVAGGRWPDDTVLRTWEHWTRTQGNPFQKATDLLAVVAGSIAQDAKDVWDRLLAEALVGDPNRFIQQYRQAGTSNQLGRDLVESLKCPASLVNQVADEPNERFQVIRHTRLWILDVLAPDSAAVTRAIDWCRSALASGDRTEAQDLFKALATLAGERRPRSGSISRQELIALVAPSFTLRVAPTHEPSWAKIDAHSAELQEDVRTTVNEAMCFTHPAAWSDIQRALNPGRVVVLEGESGSGKSALAKRLGHGRRRVLWLSAADLEHTTLGSVGAELGTTVPLDTLVGEERSTNPLLVIDSAERLTTDGRRVAAKLIAAAIKAANAWQVVITAQAGGAESLVQEIDTLTQEMIQTVEIRLPAEEAIRSIIPALGVTLSSKATPSLLRLLRNLKALDWAARLTQKQDLKGFPDLVEQVWKHLLGSDNARARGEILKRLGKEDAKLVVGGVPSSMFPDSGDQQIIAGMIGDGVLRERRERLFFRHDLLGDWARLLILIESGENASQTLTEVSSSFRWGPAIRLFAQWLLQEGDAERARLVSFIVATPSNPGSVALLEGMFQSPDCGPALAAILDDEAWGTARALNGLLSTFESVATQPAAIVRAVSKAHPEAASIRSTFRTPVHELWPAVMAVMASRSDRLAQQAPVRLGSVMRRWLSDPATGVREDLLEVHQACSKLAVAAAREFQARFAESKYSRLDGAEHAFEAALYAAPWLPDEVASLCLELSTRRPEPQAATERAEAEQRRLADAVKERLAKMTPQERKRRKQSFSLGPTPTPRREALAGGPTNRVNEEFRTAVLASGALARLMACRPAEAQEILLACCLEDPTDEDPLYSNSLHGNHTGTVDPMAWFPPLYLRGPWLSLLGHVPEQGLDAVMRLVSAATEEWLRLNIPPKDHPRYQWVVQVSTVTLNIAGTQRVFRGDHQLFAWYRGHGHSGNIVASALMALEFWLYNLLDNKQPIDWIVTRILETGTSAALLGVLAAVGRKDPALLDGPLLALIPSWLVLDWDEHITRQDSMPPFDPFGLKSLNTVFHDEADRWSDQPHRKVSLPWLIAQGLALNHAAIVEACGTARSAWQAELESGTCLSPDTVRRLIALLDPKNLTLTRYSAGEIVLSVQWPADLQAEYDAKKKSADDGVNAAQLLKVVRKLLDEPRALTNEQAELIWSTAAALSDPEGGDARDAFTIHDARAAAAAALENHASGWLDGFPDRRAWCETAAVAVFEGRTRHDSHTGGISMFKEYGESFGGAWGIVRLASGDAREVVLRAIAESVTAREHIVTGQVLAVGIQMAAKMPGELERLFNLLWLWAALRNLPNGHWKTDSWEAKIAALRRQRLVDAYVQRRIPLAPIPWDDLNLRAARVRARHDRISEARRPKWGPNEEPPSPLPPLPSAWEEFQNHGFNWSLLEKVTEPIPYVVRPSVTAALRPLVEFDRRLLDLAVWSMKRGRGRRRESSDSLPDMLDRHTLSRAASIIAAHENEDAALAIWKTLAPHLALHHHWAEAFFDSWFACSRKTAEQATQFHRRWQLMIAHTDESPEWTQTQGEKWYDLQKAKSALLGLHERGSKLGIAEDRPFLAKMIERYRRWAQEFAADTWRLLTFCHFLQKPGAVDLRLPALTWIRDAMSALAVFRVSEKRLLTEVVGLCTTVWYQQPQAVLANVEARAALIAIVQHLTQLQVQEIQELKADLETAVAQGPSAEGAPG